MLIGTAQGDALVRELEAHGIHAAVIGYADSGNDRLLHSGEITRYLERPRLQFDGNYTWKGQKRWQSLILYCWNLKFRQIQEI